MKSVDEKVCIKCGETFNRTMNGYKAWLKRQYCSRRCFGKEKDQSLPEYKVCPVCGKTFNRPDGRGATQWRKQVRCSPACAHSERSFGGLVDTREYSIWTNMKTRCTNPKSDDWENYGGRGIKICDRWINDFKAFLSDMGTCPTGLSLDRINNDGNYSPENFRWATSAQQHANRRHRKDSRR